MTNSDDTPPSNSEDESPSNGTSEEGGKLEAGPADDGASDGTGSGDGDSGFTLPRPNGADEGESTGDGGGLADRLGGSGASEVEELDEADEDDAREGLQDPTGDTTEEQGTGPPAAESAEEIEEIPDDAIEIAGDLDEPSGLDDADGGEEGTGTLMGGFEARQVESAMSGDESSGAIEEPEGAPGEEDQEVFDLDDQDEDLIIEEDAFDEAREAEQSEVFGESSSDEYDVGPTVVSDEFLEVEEDEVPADDAGSNSAASSGLSSVSQEMESAEEAGALDDVSGPEAGESTLEEEGAAPRAESERLGEVASEMESAEAAGDLGEVSAPDDATVVDQSVQPGESEGFEAIEEGQEFHGEATLDADDDALREDDFEQDEYEETIISEEGFDLEGAPQNPPTPEQSGHGVPASPTSVEPGGPAVDEEPDEFASQKTELFDPEEREESDPPRIEILKGPEAGREFLLDGRRHRIGRSTDNDVVIRDEAMSREHIEVVENPDGTYSIRDLGSVNGTLLNGTKIEETELFDGDRVEAGKTTFQFQDPDPAVAPEDRGPRDTGLGRDSAEARKPKHITRSAQRDDTRLTTWLNRIIIGAAALMVPLTALFIYLIATTTGGPTPAEIRDMTQARQAYLSAVDAMKTRDWQAAAQDFERAGRLDSDLPRLDALLDEVESERNAESRLEKAREALENGKRKRAIALAKKVPKESAYYDAARDIVRREQRERRLASLREKAHRQFEQGRAKGALTNVERLLETAPYDTEALALRQRVIASSEVDVAAAEERAEKRQEEADEGANGEEEELASRDEGGGGDEGGGTGSSGGSGDESTGSSWLIDDSDDDSSGGGGGGGGGSGQVDFQRGYALYNQGRFEAAIAHFQDAAGNSSGGVAGRAKKLARNIGEFQKNYEGGQKSLNSGQWNRAVRQFRTALGADKSVASARYFQSEIETGIAKAKAKLGLQQFNTGSYGKAFDSYKAARRYDSSHSAVRTLMRKLEKKATSLYIQAKTKRKTDPGKAASICRTIMAMVPKNNDSYRKAKKLLEGI